MGFRTWLRTKYIRAILNYAQRRPFMSVIPMSGEEGEAVDTIVVRLGSDEKTRRFAFINLTKDGASGLWFANDRQRGLPSHIPNSVLAAATHFSISHFIKGYKFDYETLRQFVWASTTLHAWRFIRRDRLDQKRFNKKLLVRRDRMNVLKIFVERSIADDKFTVSAFGLLSEIYTNRWVRHPEQDALHRHYDLILESLQQSGELKVTRTGYAITPKALTTLSQYEEDDRRHEDNRRQQRTLELLTLALVLVGICQAAITVWQELNPDP